MPSKFLRTVTLKENNKGELILTFTPQELKIMGVAPGEWVDFEVINGTLHIKRAKGPIDPKMASKVTKMPKKKRPTPKK